MPSDLTSLIDAATALIKALNVPGNNYVPLLKLMEYNVVLKRVRFSDAVSGIGNVHGYLDFHMFDRKPKLVNANANAPFPPNPAYTDALTQTPTDAQNATTGQVTGAGKYVDDNDASITPINFTLNFVRKSTNPPDNNWSLISSFATLI
jgi:hypothetical protein